MGGQYHATESMAGRAARGTGFKICLENYHIDMKCRFVYNRRANLQLCSFSCCHDFFLTTEEPANGRNQTPSIPAAYGADSLPYAISFPRETATLEPSVKSSTGRCISSVRPAPPGPDATERIRRISLLGQQSIPMGRPRRTEPPGERPNRWEELGGRPFERRRMPSEILTAKSFNLPGYLLSPRQ
jgi:hypothetical protein